MLEGRAGQVTLCKGLPNTRLHFLPATQATDRHHGKITGAVQRGPKRQQTTGSLT
jgi:hypothetical protein